MILHADVDVYVLIVYMVGHGLGYKTEVKLWYYLTHSWGDKGTHTFPKGISPNMIVIVRLVFKFAYF